MTREEFLSACGELKEEYKQSYKPRFEIGQCVEYIGRTSTVPADFDETENRWAVERVLDVNHSGYHEYAITNVKDRFKFGCFIYAENELIAVQ